MAFLCQPRGFLSHSPLLTPALPPTTASCARASVAQAFLVGQSLNQGSKYNASCAIKGNAKHSFLVLVETLLLVADKQAFLWQRLLVDSTPWMGWVAIAFGGVRGRQRLAGPSLRA